MKVDRRQFLGFAAGAAAGTATGVSAARALSDLVAVTDEPIYPERGPEDFVLSVCRMCSAGCGIRVRRVGGRPVKLDGNPLHPISGGRLCPRGQAGLQSLYHPDRIPNPLRRVGPRGSIDSFEPATWEEALDAIGQRLALLRQVERPESLAVIRGPDREIGTRLASRFLRAFGSPNEIVLQRGDEAAALAVEACQGLRAAPTFDIGETDYVLSVGAALLEASSSPVRTMRAYGEFRQGRPGRRGKLVQVESRLSITASSADEWIAVRPGTEGILALGVARVLVAEDLYDKDFVSQTTVGLDPWVDSTGRSQPGLRELLVRDFPLERVARQTGTSVNLVLRLAREFAAARRKLAVGPSKGPLLPGSLFDHLAAQVLNGLAGNVDSPGGVLVPERFEIGGLPPLPDDEVAARGRERPPLGGRGADAEAFAEALVRGPEYPVEVLVLLNVDPAFASASPGLFAQALPKVPLVVSIASLPLDSALLSDWILPDAHFLETWNLVTGAPGVPHPVVSLSQPALDAPICDARPAASIFLSLAAAVGGEVAAALPWKEVEVPIRSEVGDLFVARRGTIMGTEFDEAWVRMMERAGWWAPGYASVEELWTRMRETGGWWDPFYDHGDWDRVLRTPSGRFEFPTGALERLADTRKETARAGLEAGSEPPSDAPLALLLFEPLAVAGGTGAELPFLQELLDPGLEESWETWAEVHPETASRLGVRDHDRVRLTSEEGSIEAVARVTRRVVADAVAVPVGLGKAGGGRWAAGRGANPLLLLGRAREEVGGLPDPRATRVRLAVVARGRRRHHEAGA